MTVNKDHLYDGWFYDKVIAPNQDKLFGQIKNIIKPGSTVIDIGCGTGRLAFKLADNCKTVLGIDLSVRNINRAQLLLARKPHPGITFEHSNLSRIIKTGNARFDYAVMTYVIHEVDEAERIDLLTEASEVAEKIIIGDYVYPRPSGFVGSLSATIEFIAGREHYNNYKSYMKNGGIHFLAKKAGLKVVSEKLNNPSANHIVVLEK